MMFQRIFSAGLLGIDAHIVSVEADISGGLPQFQMVGLLSSEVREARERVTRAFSNSEIELPARKITVSLSPASMKKKGSGFDLPIAVAILAALGTINNEGLEEIMFIGELSLDGHVNRCDGILPAALMARDEGFRTLVVPAENAFEGAAVDGICICAVSSLKELIEMLETGALPDIRHISLEEELDRAYRESSLDYSDIQGQEKAKRATKVAVAGFHNLLYIGPPGSGKSMMARRIPTILGRLSREECLEISKIYSVMGMLKDQSLVLLRPFRSPHHSITGPALVGGMGNPRPGEITLAHKGILFLDEAAEFKKDVIEQLRQPLEDRQIVISRMWGNMTFPADFMLVLASNPCPCGMWPSRECQCSQIQVDRYLGKLKGPILDRIDICAGTSVLEPGELKERSGPASEEIRRDILMAQEIQAERFAGRSVRFNSQMTQKEIDEFCIIGRNERELLDSAYKRCHMSARGYYKVLKVARTIADLEGSREIRKPHLMEAIGYRNPYWK